MGKELGQLVETLVDPKGFIVVNRTMIEKFGPLEAIVLGELIGESNYWRREGKLEDGFFFSTVENLENNTFIKRRQQERIVKDLISTGVLEMKIKDSPPKRYFKINYEVYSSILLNDDFQYAPAVLNDTHPASLSIRTAGATNKNNTIEINKSTKKKLFSPTGNFFPFIEKYYKEVEKASEYIKNNYFNNSSMIKVTEKQVDSLNKIFITFNEEQVQHLYNVNLIEFIQEEIINNNFYNKKTGKTVFINFSTIYNNVFGLHRQLKFNSTNTIMSDSELETRKEMNSDYHQAM